MPRRFYRKKRASKRKTYRKRKLSKFNVLTKKSASSQAGQIYALTKKVNSMYRRLKPTIYRYDTATQDYQIFKWDANSQSAGYSFNIRPAANLYVGMGGNHDFTIKDYYFQFKLYYYHPTQYSTTQVTDGEEGAEVDPTGDVLVRMVVIQYTSSQENAIPIGDIMPNNGIYAISQPLDPNAGRRCKILRDKVFRISKNKPMIQINYKMPWHWKTVNYDAQSARFKNEIEIFFYGYNLGRQELGTYSYTSYAFCGYGERYYYITDKV